MGAAAVLVACGESLPVQVKAVISDSSYTTAVDELKYEYRKQKGALIPAAFMMQMIRVIGFVRTGYDIAKASPLDAVSRSLESGKLTRGIGNNIIVG